MPTYEYVCSACAHAWEEIQKISEPPVEKCPSCHAETAKRQISGGNFILKGGGWYSDLYSKPPPAKGASESSASSSASTTPTTSTPAATPSTAPSAAPAAAPAASKSST